MVLPVDMESYSYRFYQNLNKDVKLKSDKYGRWDIDFNNETDDWVIVDGFESVFNACVIAILTRFDELEFMELYDDFGCRIHELIKANKSNDVLYRMELFVTEVLNNMRRIEKVNWVRVTDNPNGQTYDYQVSFNVTCLIDEDADLDELDTGIIEGEFLV